MYDKKFDFFLINGNKNKTIFLLIEHILIQNNNAINNFLRLLYFYHN